MIQRSISISDSSCIRSKISLHFRALKHYLFLEGVEVVVVDVRVTQRVHELPGGQPRDVSDHVREKGVAARGEAESKFLLYLIF